MNDGAVTGILVGLGIVAYTWFVTKVWAGVEERKGPYDKSRPFAPMDNVGVVMARYLGRWGYKVGIVFVVIGVISAVKGLLWP